MLRAKWLGPAAPVSREASIAPGQSGEFMSPPPGRQRLKRPPALARQIGSSRPRRAADGGASNHGSTLASTASGLSRQIMTRRRIRRALFIALGVLVLIA
jgi:hypothetical protein